MIRKAIARGRRPDRAPTASRRARRCRRRDPHADPLGGRRSRRARGCSTRRGASRGRGRNIARAMATIPARHLTRVFEEVGGYDEIVLLKDIPFQSHCEHHMAPIIGKAHIAYLPRNHVVGISKLARVLHGFARRLQVQERLTAEVADCIWDGSEAAGRRGGDRGEPCLHDRARRAHARRGDGDQPDDGRVPRRRAQPQGSAGADGARLIERRSWSPAARSGSARRSPRGWRADGHRVVIHYGTSARRGARRWRTRSGRRGSVAGDLADRRRDRPICSRARASAAGGPIDGAGQLARRCSSSTGRRRSIAALAGAAVRGQLHAPGAARRRRSRGRPDVADGAVVNLLDQKLANPNPDFFSYTLQQDRAGRARPTMLAQALAPARPGQRGRAGPDAAERRPEPRRVRAVGAPQPAAAGRSAPRRSPTAVVYLLGARSVTGQTLFVDCGQRFCRRDARRDVRRARSWLSSRPSSTGWR